ncbi:MAG: extracellular solute-binding protein [Lachnospiraceae bacterium]|nr:extracellular solute-binding protein [Lachnospiraceae bacterium]
MNAGRFHRRLGIFAVIAVLFMLLVTGADRNFHLTKNKKLTVGLFSDSYWGVQNGYAYQILEDAISRFHETWPDVEVTYESGIVLEDYSEWLAEKILSHDAPDVFVVLLDDRNNLAEIGTLEPLSSYAEYDESFHASDYYDAAYQTGVIGSELYTLPFECAPKLMFVNKTILNNEGISMPELDWTWDDFLEICVKATKDTNGNGAIDQYGASGYTWKDAADSNGIRLFDEKGTACYFNSEEMEQVLLFFDKLEQALSGNREKEPDFEKGNVVFEPMYFSEYRSFKSNELSGIRYSDFSWDCVPMPAGPSADTLSVLDTLSFGMSASSENKQLSWELIKCLTYDPQIQSEIFIYSDGISALRAVTESRETADRLEQQSGGAVNPAVMKYVMEHAGTEPHFRQYEEAVQEAGRSVDIILKESFSIQMEQVIQNRRLNQYMQSLGN